MSTPPKRPFRNISQNKFEAYIERVGNGDTATIDEWWSTSDAYKKKGKKKKELGFFRLKGLELGLRFKLRAKARAKTRQDKARQDGTGQNIAKQGKARHGKAR